MFSDLKKYLLYNIQAIGSFQVSLTVGLGVQVKLTLIHIFTFDVHEQRKYWNILFHHKIWNVKVHKTFINLRP